MSTQSTQEAVAEIWNLFRETDSRLARLAAETRQQFRETDSRLARLAAETRQQFQETDGRLARLAAETRQQFQETDERRAAKAREQFQEIRKQFRETDERLDRRFSETDAALRRLEGMFGIQWGRMMEALVQPAVLQLFREWGINVHRTSRRVESQVNGQHMELDLVLENDVDVVVVEVKSLVRVQDVDDLVVDLTTLPTFFTRFAGRSVYGGIAGLEFAEGADRYAFRQGLFVLALSGEGMVKIRNGSNFRPKDFGQR